MTPARRAAAALAAMEEADAREPHPATSAAVLQALSPRSAPDAAPAAAPRRETPALRAMPAPKPETKREKTPPPVTARAEDPRPASASAASAETPVAAAQAAIGVVILGTGEAADAALRCAAKGWSTVYVAAGENDPGIARAEEAGAHVALPGDRAPSPGRARNAGYRQIKKLRPDLRYVQFVEAGAALDADWLEPAMRFMERRPEVAVIEGRMAERGRRASVVAAAMAHGTSGRTGEIQVTDETFLVRTEAFEAAGGFRGDLPANEVEDLCIRLRRRGSHVWRLDVKMGERAPRAASLFGWWRQSMRAGYRYAQGARLHGAPPERLFVREHLGSLIWGAGLPFLIIVAAALGGGATQIAAPQTNPLYVVAMILAFGGGVYLLKALIAAFVRGPHRPSAWVYGLLSTFGHVPEFLGAWRFYLTAGSKRAKG